MAQSEPQIFKDVTPDQYAHLIQKAKGAGIEMTGNSGTASKFVVEVKWNYVPEAQELTLQCVGVPFFMNAADVDAKIRDLVKESLV